MSQRVPEQSSSNVPLIPAFLLFGGLTLILVALFAANTSQREEPPSATVVAVEPTAVPTEIPTEAVIAAAVYDPAVVRQGEQIYSTLCFACHGFDGRGISGLGKTLIGSEYITSISDDDLVAFISVGREVSDPLNTTGVAMPAKGGNPNLTDEDIRAVVAYIRSLNTEETSEVAAEPTTPPESSAPVGTPAPFIAPAEALGLISPEGSGDNAVTQDPVETQPNQFLSSGENAYNWSCAGCHGLNGEGVDMLGPALAASDLVQDQDGIGLLAYLTLAQPPVDPNVTYPHPYRGGYPILTDTQLLDIIAYMYTLQNED